MENVQSILGLGARKSQRKGEYIFLVMVFLLTGIHCAISQPEEQDRMVDSLRRNVVRIEAKDDSGERNGFGFIVGERAGRLYIVTAHHVVLDPNAVVSTKAVKVRLEFFSRRGKMYDAEILGTHDSVRDLAVLTVPSSLEMEWTRECLADSQKRGTSVWFVGQDREWKPSVSPGHLLSGPSINGLFEIDGMSVKPGSSGGPAISDNGIIGMIETDSADNTQILGMEFIKKDLAEWNHPWDLQPAHPLISINQPDDQAAIKGVLHNYAECFNHRDSASLWQIYPNVEQSTKQKIEDSFRNARSISMSLSADDPAILTDDTALVTGKFSQQYVASDGSKQKSHGSVNFRLMKKNKVWILTQVQNTQVKK